MNHADDSLTKAFPAANWLFQPAAFGEAVDVLSKALGTEWAIERETDCYGEISIIALPNNDQAPRPGFILYEKNGRTHVATIVDDEWNRDEGFDSFRSGVRLWTQSVHQIITAANATEEAKLRANLS